jgi:hypothetical protein
MKVSTEPATTQNPNLSSLPGTVDLLRETFALVRTFPGHFFGYSGWLLVPVVLSLLSSTILPADVQTFADLLLNNIVYIVLALWAVVSIMIFTMRTLRQQATDDTQINTQAWSLVLPYGIVSLCTSFLGATGFLLFVIPGVLMWTWFSFSGLAFVAGDAGLGTCFQKSRELSRGRFYEVFSRLFLGSLFYGLLYALFLIPIALFFSHGASFDLAAYLESVPSLGEQLCFNALDILFLPLSIAFQGVLYHHLTKTLSGGQEPKIA